MSYYCSTNIQKILFWLQDLLFEDGVLCSFSQISTEYSLPCSDLFRYFQICHFLQPLFASFPRCPPESVLEDVLGLLHTFQKRISNIYSNVVSMGIDSVP